MEITLGLRIAELRKKRNMTQSDLANSLDMSTSSVAMWETGKREPDTDKIAKIADLFNVSVDYLLGRTDVLENAAPDETPPTFKTWLRSEHNDLTENEKEVLAEDMEEYFRMRKARILQKRNKN